MVYFFARQSASMLVHWSIQLLSSHSATHFALPFPLTSNHPRFILSPLLDQVVPVVVMSGFLISRIALFVSLAMLLVNSICCVNWLMECHLRSKALSDQQRTLPCQHKVLSGRHWSSQADESPHWPNEGSLRPRSSSQANGAYLLKKRASAHAAFLQWTVISASWLVIMFAASAKTDLARLMVKHLISTRIRL